MRFVGRYDSSIVLSGEFEVGSEIRHYTAEPPDDFAGRCDLVDGVGVAAGHEIASVWELVERIDVYEVPVLSLISVCTWLR